MNAVNAEDEVSARDAWLAAIRFGKQEAAEAHPELGRLGGDWVFWWADNCVGGTLCGQRHHDLGETMLFVVGVWGAHAFDRVLGIDVTGTLTTVLAAVEAAS